jgi:hypothetical protein
VRGILNGQSGGFPIKERERVVVNSIAEINRGDFVKVVNQVGEPSLPVTTAALETAVNGRFYRSVVFELPNGFRVNFWKNSSQSVVSATVLDISTAKVFTSTTTILTASIVWMWCVKKVSDYCFILSTSDSSSKGLYFYKITINPDNNNITCVFLGSNATTSYVKNAMMIELSQTKGIVVYGTGANAKGFSDSCYLKYVVYTYDGTSIAFSTETQLDYQTSAPYTPFFDYHYYGDNDLMFVMYGFAYDVVFDGSTVAITKKNAITAYDSSYRFIDNLTSKINITISYSYILRFFYNTTDKSVTCTLLHVAGSNTNFKYMRADNDVFIGYPKNMTKILYNDSSNAYDLGFGKYLILSQYVNTASGRPAFFTITGNNDFSSFSTPLNTFALTTGYMYIINGSFFAWIKNGYVFFVWYNSNANAPYFLVTSLTYGALPDVSKWDGIFDANTLGLALNSASNGDDLKVLIPQ